MEFKLEMAFSNAQLEVIAETNTKVVVAKPTAGSEPNVAWQAFDPLNDNTLTWEEQYGIYVSTSKIADGVKLEKLSSTGVPAADHKLYTLKPSGAISDPADGGEAGSFSLLNSYDKQDVMTVGLYQDATVNGTAIAGNAISAAGVMLASTAKMTPYTLLYIWLQSRVESNTVITQVTSPMTPLKFGGATTHIATAYDTKTGQFLPNNG